MGRASDFVEKHFGVRTTVRDTHYVVSDTPTRIAQNSADRLVLSITNAGGQTLGVSLFPGDFTRSAFLLGAGGGNLILEVSEDGELVSHEVYARTLAGTTDVIVVEVIGE